MGLSKREINNIVTIDKNNRFIDKGFKPFYKVSLIFFAVLLVILIAVIIRETSSWYDVLLTIVLLFSFYSLATGIVWGLLSLYIRSGRRYIQKMNISPQEYDAIIKEHSKDKWTEMYEQLTKRYQVDKLNDLPEFQVPENPIIQEKISNWLGWGELDKEQKKEKISLKLWIIGLGGLLLVLGLLGSDGKTTLSLIGGGIIVFGLFTSKGGGRAKQRRSSDSVAIYTGLLHYWNKRFFLLHYHFRHTTDTAFGKAHIFDADDSEKVKIENWYEAPHPVVEDISDRISYVYKRNKNIYKNNGNNDIGILWNVQMPDVKEIETDISDNFYLIPTGNVPKNHLYDYHSTIEDGYDLYTTGELSTKALERVLELIRPLTERNWEAGVEYTGGYMYIYLPGFLPNIDNVTKEEDLLQVCRRMDSFYSFLKRSFIWRYGDIAIWNKGEKL